MKVAVRSRFSKKDDKSGDSVDNYELRIDNMMLLDNTKESFVTELHVAFPLSRVNEQFRKDLLKLVKKHKGGNARLYVDISFSAEGKDEHLTLFSKKHKVVPSYELYDSLDKMGVRYRIEKKRPQEWFTDK